MLKVPDNQPKAPRIKARKEPEKSLLPPGSINRLSEVLASQGMENVRPSKVQLGRLEIPSLIAWNKIIERKNDPSLRQAYLICQWLKVPVADLFPNPGDIDLS